MGNHCDDVCPEGFYGKHCMEFCSCPSPQFVCHAARGCICRLGFDGIDCLTPSQGYLERNADHSADITWGVIVALMLVGVIVLVIMYYRRSMRNIKTELAHVQYIADPSSQPDRHHFDNPVYAFGTTPTIPDSTTLLNNLRPHKPTNLDRHKLGYSDNDSLASSRGKYGIFALNY